VLLTSFVEEGRRNILAKAKFAVLALEEKYVLLQTEVYALH